MIHAVAIRLARALAIALALGGAAPVGAEPAPVAEAACGELVMFSRDGCPHCADAAVFLDALQARHPELEIRIRDVGRDPAARDALRALALRHGVSTLGVPAFAGCGRFRVGFDAPATTGAELEGWLLGRAPSALVEVPLLGSVDPAALGLPLFTLVLGLVDGFNPCAIWVLLFLLSVLVNVRDRRRIVVVAGTFVLVSGLAYYAFMAAWLNVFLLVGVSRATQVVLALVALAVGGLHVKDFFALGRGPSLSIPEAAKPGIYARVRRIVNAESLGAALVGATVLAVLVNVVELLCTAGIPAVYTRVLTLRELPTWQYYAYLGLYDLAYMLDDSLLVATVVIGLRRTKLQETQGRWLKGLSGLVILLLGLALLLAPDWLVW